MSNKRKITVEASESLHKKATRAAKKQGITLSDLVRKALKTA